MNQDILLRIIASFSLLVAGFVMIFARRYKNKDADAGYCIAGWIIFAIIIIWLTSIMPTN